MNGATGGDVVKVLVEVVPMSALDALSAVSAVVPPVTPEVPSIREDDMPCTSKSRRSRKSSPSKIVGRCRQPSSEVMSPGEEAPSSSRGRSATRNCGKRKRQTSELIIMILMFCVGRGGILVFDM